MFWVSFLSDDLLNSYYFGSSHKRNFPRNLSFKTSSEFSAFQTTLIKVTTSRIYKLRENTRNPVKSKVSLQTHKHWQPELGHRVEDNLNLSSVYWISNNSSKLNCRYDPTATRVPIDLSFIANAWLTDVGDYICLKIPLQVLVKRFWEGGLLRDVLEASSRGSGWLKNPKSVILRSLSRLRDCELATGTFLLSKTLSDSGSGSTVISKGQARRVVATISFGPLSMSIGTVLSTSLSSIGGFVFAFCF